ncbi:MAG: glycosyltransferase [Candidatus Micrarchaeota archaeon]|nr:glycosyltransferase [Candidatus Micrarchaeota archaeon]
MPAKNNVDISFCIRAYNEERFMESKLNDLIPRLKMAGARSEIVMVIQGNDDSYRIASSFRKEFKNLVIHRMQKPDFLKATNFMIGKTKSDIIVIDDADNLFKGDIDRIVKIFKDPKVGGIIQFDVATREWLNDGHRLFDQVYKEVQLKHHLKGNVVDSPIFYVHIWRKSALRPPYATTLNDDTETTLRLQTAGYEVIYDKELSEHIENNPLQKKITVKGIFKRRLRTEKFRKQAKEVLNTDRFAIKNRIGEFVEAIFLTMGRANPAEFLGFMEYLIVIALATMAGKIKLLIKDDNKYVQVR